MQSVTKLQAASPFVPVTARAERSREVPSASSGGSARTSLQASTVDLWMTALYLGVTTILLTALGKNQLTEQNPWSVGDWLINYQGGFVRRGLPGEIAWKSASILHLSPAACVVAMQMALYGVLLFCVWRLVQRSTCSLWVKAFLLSPATVAFPVLDVEGGFRKEILLLAGLALLVMLLQRAVRSPAAISVYVAAAAVILVLSHEAMIFYLPYWYAVVALALRSAKRAALLLLPAAACVVVGWLAVVQHAGNADVARHICESLGSGGGDYCSGSIAALIQTRADAHAQVMQMLIRFTPVHLYVALAAASLLPALFPLVGLIRRQQMRWQFCVVVGSTLTSFALTSVLFVYALDWGRWIYIHAFCLFLVLLFLDGQTPGQRQLAPARSSAWWYVPLLIFATAWGLPRMPGTSPLQTSFLGHLHLLR